MSTGYGALVSDVCNDAHVLRDQGIDHGNHAAHRTET